MDQSFSCYVCGPETSFFGSWLRQNGGQTVQSMSANWDPGFQDLGPVQFCWTKTNSHEPKLQPTLPTPLRVGARLASLAAG